MYEIFFSPNQQYAYLAFQDTNFLLLNIQIEEKCWKRTKIVARVI